MRTMTINKIDTEVQRARAEERGETAAMSREEAESLAPWAAAVVDVDGGWMAFESADDAAQWAAQG